MSARVLGDLCELVVDCKNRTPPEAPQGEGVAFAIGTPHVLDGRIQLQGAKSVTQETFDTWTARAIPRVGDVVLTREAPVGRVGRVEEGMKICLGQRTMLLRADSKRTDAKYLKYLLLSKEIQSTLHAHSSGSTVPHLRVAQVRNLPIPSVPALESQRAIGDVLGALDDKIAVNERIAVTHEKLLKLQVERMGLEVDSDPAIAMPITEFVHFNPKVSKPSTEAVYVDMAALPTGRAGIATWARREPKGGTRFVNGDTLLARITPCLENGKTGYVDFMEEGEIGVGSTEFIVMRSAQGIPSEFSYFLARSNRFREHAIRNMIGSSGRQRVAAADAANFHINRPDEKLLAEFGEVASDSFEHMRSLDRESRTLAALRDTLLPQLMSGKLRVREAEKIVEDAV
ncbi:restriction endonuclease subunit S [Streptomyces sp. NPDC007083]|uniref:restriction endonuclease subunit S n=1 Tax=Streptomyces sp. NPDC007083 TaxID=3156913 RepID=UPI0033C845EF